MLTWKQELCDQLEEELEGVENYAQLSRLADADGNHEVARFLAVIAHEEMTHAEYLKKALMGMGLYTPEKDSTLNPKWDHAWNSLKS